MAQEDIKWEERFGETYHGIWGIGREPRAVVGLGAQVAVKGHWQIYVRESLGWSSRNEGQWWMWACGGPGLE